MRRDAQIMRHRNQAARFCNWIKHSRHIGTRHEKLVAIGLWLQVYKSTVKTPANSGCK